MVQGYTAEGHAILKNKGNVEELSKAYEEQKKAAQDAVLANSEVARDIMLKYGNERIETF